VKDFHHPPRGQLVTTFTKPDKCNYPPQLISILSRPFGYTLYLPEKPGAAIDLHNQNFPHRHTVSDPSGNRFRTGDQFLGIDPVAAEKRAPLTVHRLRPGN